MVRKTINEQKAELEKKRAAIEARLKAINAGRHGSAQARYPAEDRCRSAGSRGC